MKYLFVILIGLNVYGADFETEAKKILGPIKKAFMGELKSGMKEGPYNAIDSCHLKAPHLIEHDQGDQYEIGRTSNKIRNPKNKAPKWAQEILAKYEKSTAENPMKPHTFDVGEDKKAYVEPIYVKPLCLNCHGAARGSVAKKLKKLYPEDGAMGYKVGDFRGLFYIKQK